MKTTQMLAMAAFALGLSLGATSEASMVMIDNFSTSQNIVSDTTADSIAVSSTNAGRTLSHNLLSFEDPPIESSAGITEGKLDIHNGTGNNSEVTVAWFLNAGLFSGVSSATLNFDVLNSNGSPTSINFLFNDAQLATFEIPANSANNSISFALPASQLSNINNGGTLMLDISGTPGWDLTVDNFGITIDERAATAPEPTLMGLVGLSLTGLGLLRRKKRDR